MQKKACYSTHLQQSLRLWFRISLYCLPNFRSQSLTIFQKYCLLGQHMHWQEWKMFGCSYIAFRLSLFTVLGYTTLPLTVNLSGTTIDCPNDKTISLPPFESVKCIRIPNQFPSTCKGCFSNGECGLNAPNASLFTSCHPMAGYLLQSSAKTPRLQVNLV